MDTGCCIFINNSRCWNLFTRLPCIRDDEDDGDVDHVSLTDDDSVDGAELLAEAQDVNDDGAQLLAAAIDGTRADDVLSILVRKPGLIRIADPIGDTVFHVVARLGYLATVRKLIEFMKERKDLKLLKEVLLDTNVDGDTALHLALFNAHHEVAYCLASANKEVAFVRNNDGIRPYELAEKAGYRDVCSVCYWEHTPYSAVCDLDMTLVRKDLGYGSGSLGIRWSELQEAVNKGLGKFVVKRLMKGKGGRALLSHQDCMGETLLHAAVKAVGRGVGPDPLVHLVQFMIDNSLTDAALLGNKKGDTALHLALQNGELSAAMCLIKAAPGSVHQVNSKGVSPLYLVVKGGHHDLVKYMFQTMTQSSLVACATQVLQYPNNTTLAHLAIKAKSLGTLQTLMEHLPELINQTDEKGWRPLSYAAYRGYLDEVIYLLAKFPESVEKYDTDGSLPIHKAVGGGHVSIIQAFVSHNPQSLYHVNKKGQSVLHVAARYEAKARANKDDVLAYLKMETKTDDAFQNLKDHEGKTYMDYTKEQKPSIF